MFRELAVQYKLTKYKYEIFHHCLYFMQCVFCSVRYSGCSGGLPGLPPQAAALWPHQHRPHHPEGRQNRLTGGPHQRGHGEGASGLE